MRACVRACGGKGFHTQSDVVPNVTLVLKVPSNSYILSRNTKARHCGVYTLWLECLDRKQVYAQLYSTARSCKGGIYAIPQSDVLPVYL